MSQCVTKHNIGLSKEVQKQEASNMHKEYKAVLNAMANEGVNVFQNTT